MSLQISSRKDAIMACMQHWKAGFKSRTYSIISANHEVETGSKPMILMHVHLHSAHSDPEDLLTVSIQPHHQDRTLWNVAILCKLSGHEVDLVKDLPGDTIAEALQRLHKMPLVSAHAMRATKRHGKTIFRAVRDLLLA